MSDHWKPVGLIKEIKVDVDPNVIWPLGYEPQDSYELPARAGKFYRAARVQTSEPRDPMNTHQWAHSELTVTCPRCHGKGATRRDQNVGCQKCHGTGGIDK